MFKGKQIRISRMTFSESHHDYIVKCIFFYITVNGNVYICLNKILSFFVFGVWLVFGSILMLHHIETITI